MLSIEDYFIFHQDVYIFEGYEFWNEVSSHIRGDGFMDYYRSHIDLFPPIGLIKLMGSGQGFGFYGRPNSNYK
jgi:hypothetical protein